METTLISSLSTQTSNEMEPEEPYPEWDFPELDGDWMDTVIKEQDSATFAPLTGQDLFHLQAMADDPMEEEEEQVGGGASGPADPMHQQWDLQRHKKRGVKKFGVTLHDFTFRPSTEQIEALRQNDDLHTTMDHVNEALIGLVRRATREAGLKESQRATITFQSTQLDIPIRLSWMPISQMTNEVIEATFERAMQSHKDFVIDEGVIVNVTALEDPRGGGRSRKRSYASISDNLKHDDSVVCPPMDAPDEMCLARCLVYGLKFHQADGDRAGISKALKRLKTNASLWTGQAMDLCVQCHISPYEQAGQPELETFAAHLRPLGFVIRVISPHKDLIFKEKEPLANATILYLVLVEGHYMFIPRMTSYWGSHFFCDSCMKPYKSQLQHRCDDLCPSCKKNTCTERQREQRTLKCDTCHRYFFGDRCWTNHLNPDHTCPNNWRVCETCALSYIVRSKRPHVCGQHFCPVCKGDRPKSHKCFVPHHKFPLVKCPRGNEDGILPPVIREAPFGQPVDLLESVLDETSIDNRINIVFFDIETQQDTQEHLATLLVSQTMLGEEECIFEGPRCVDEFVQYLCDAHGEEDTTVIAHNGQGFDFQFVLQALLQLGNQPEVIMNGGKIMTITWKRKQDTTFRFVDSLNFVTKALSEFPKTFGLHLDGEQALLSKGFFPHLFHTPDNMTYVGPMPPRDTYDPSGMRPEKHDAFMAWYAQQVAIQHVFDMDAELKGYCSVDVTILREGMLEFCRKFQRVNLVNPLKHAITVAGICNKVYRAQHMPHKTIPYVPEHGYSPRQKHSRKAVEWLRWAGQQYPVSDRLQHALDGGEFRPDGVGPVDGYHASTRTCYEFHGCYWHGCPKCYRVTDENTRNNCLMGDLYEKTCAKERKLRADGYQVVTMWECEWDKLCQEDDTVKAWCQQCDFVDPLTLRDAFYGGRTGCTKLSVDTRTSDTLLNYYDYKSLYPTVNLCLRRGETPELHVPNQPSRAGPSEALGTWDQDDMDPYPTGHPEIRRHPDGGLTLEDVNATYGLIKCEVEPPAECYNPVLPYRCQNKLMFPLCATCAETQHDDYCPHTPQQRCLRGTWVSEELKLALRKGYRLVKVWEVWHYPTRSRHLFRSYIQTFQKLKEEASGWPPGVESEEKRATFLQEYEAHSGVRLDPERMISDPGSRAIAKLELNGMWGKHGERTNKLQTIYIKEPATWYKLAMDPKVDIHAVFPVKEAAMMIAYNYHDDYSDLADSASHVSVIVAAWTTWLARKKLYVELLDVLKERVCYMDTDSIIFTTAPHEEGIATGAFFGDLTDEIPPGRKMVEFASAGPKNYGYRLDNGDSLVKVRGISQTVRACKILNFNAMQNNLNKVIGDVRAGEHPQEAANNHTLTIDYPHSIVREGKAQKRIFAQDRTKRYRAVISKRLMISSLIGKGTAHPQHWNCDDTLPYGTKRPVTI